MKESDIRDFLINNLHIFDPSYKLLKKEAYLPSNMGTKSFIDILAQDKNGKYIVIELKKSNATARQAIHELFKYLEAVKENMAAKTEEIELVIASTEWDELLMPFSSFQTNTDFNSNGFLLRIEDNKITAKKIDGLNTNDDRVLSSVQMARYYKSQASLDKGITEHIDFFNKRGVKNFLLIILSSPEDYSELVLQSLQNSELQVLHKRTREEVKSMFDFKFIVYSANQLLTIDCYRAILQGFDSDNLQEQIAEIIDDDETSSYDKLEQLNELVIEQEPFPSSDFVEIGTPAKYNKFRETEGWKVNKILKFGALAENENLTDEVVESEIIASGTTKERYVSDIDLNNKANISRIKREIKNCLADNIVWRNHILEILDSLEADKKDIYRIRCSIYNPMNIIYSIYLIVTHPSGILYIPSYQIEVEHKDGNRMYIGCLDGKIANIDMQSLLNKFWNNDAAEFLLSLTWGGYQKNNLEVCEYIGIDYKTKQVTKIGDELSFYDYENYRFKTASPSSPFDNFYDIIGNSEQLVPSILDFFEKHKVGTGCWELNNN